MSEPILAVWPNTEPQRTSWVTSLDGQMTASVTSAREVVERAKRNGYAIQLEDETYAQMVAHGVAPEDRPASLFDFLADAQK